MTVFYDGFVRNDRLNARAKRVIGLGRWYEVTTLMAHMDRIQESINVICNDRHDPGETDQRDC